jgi:hypothetical protein
MCCGRIFRPSCASSASALPRCAATAFAQTSTHTQHGVGGERGLSWVAALCPKSTGMLRPYLTSGPERYQEQTPQVEVLFCFMMWNCADNVELPNIPHTWPSFGHLMVSSGLVHPQKFINSVEFWMPLDWVSNMCNRCSLRPFTCALSWAWWGHDRPQ